MNGSIHFSFKCYKFIIHYSWIKFHYAYAPYFLPSSTDEHLSWLYVLTVVNSALINMGVQASLGSVPRSGVAGSAVVLFLGRSLHTDFHSGWTCLHSHSLCSSLFPPLLLCGCLFSWWLDILTQMRWILKAILICINLISLFCLFRALGHLLFAWFFFFFNFWSYLKVWDNLLLTV